LTLGNFASLRRAAYGIFLILFGRARIEKHNQHEIYDYPERNWRLSPFPSSKGRLFNADNLSTVNGHYFKSNPRFDRAKTAAERRWGSPGHVRDISWRLHVCLWAFGQALAKRGIKSTGVFIECGTGRGYMAAGIADYHLSPPPAEDLEFLLFDTFQPDLDGSPSPADFAYSQGSTEVKAYFSRFPSVTLVEGKLPGSLDALGDRRVDFLHLDLNCARSEEEVLNFLANRFNDSAIILFDDYGGPGGEAQAALHRKFTELHGRILLELPTGQALVVW